MFLRFCICLFFIVSAEFDLCYLFPSMNWEVCFVCLSLLVMMSSVTGFDIILLFNGRPQVSSALYFKHNTALGPPYRVLVDTNFINFSIQNKVSAANVLVFIIYLIFFSHA